MAEDGSNRTAPANWSRGKKIERKDMKKTVNEVAQLLRKCADLMEHDTEFQAEFADGMSESQIMYMCILIAQKIAK